MFMNKNNPIIFIADFFAYQVPGGGELNNKNLIELLEKSGHKVNRINSNGATPGFIREHRHSKFIVGNFVGLPEASRSALAAAHYIIYEHDHKYLKSRNPADFENFHAPPEEIINRDFYKNAKMVICQSLFHEEIVRKNLRLDNITNVGGNLWSEEILDFLATLAATPKTDKCSIMMTDNWHKNTAGAVKYCTSKELAYELIPGAEYRHFLTALGKNQKLVFFPLTPETLSRIVVEARMMGMSTITSQNIGAAREDWFSLKGTDLIEHMRSLRGEILELILGHLEE
jgi:hypothetical protein